MDVAADLAGKAMPTERPGWWSTIGSVLAGTITAWCCCLTALFVAGALHLLPFDSSTRHGRGWPYPIDSAWAVIADLGPMLAVGFVFAGTTSWYMTQKTGVHPRRWPLALVAAAVGWFPLGGEPHGVLLFTGAGAFAAVVIAARALSLAERRPTPWSRPLVATLAALVVALGCVTVSYGALHPLTASSGESDQPTELRAGHSTRVAFFIDNHGPTDVRVRDVTLVGVSGLRIARAAVDDPAHASAPSMAELFKRLHGTTVHPGYNLVVYLSLAANACATRGANRARWTVETLDVRLRSAGIERTQRVALDDEQLVSCRAAVSR